MAANLIHIAGVVGLVFSLIGAGTATIGAYLNSDDIKKVSGTYFDSNIHLERALRRQSRATVFGFGFVTIGTVLQIFAAMA